MNIWVLHEQPFTMSAGAYVDSLRRAGLSITAVDEKALETGVPDAVMLVYPSEGWKRRVKAVSEKCPWVLMLDRGGLPRADEWDENCRPSAVIATTMDVRHAVWAIRQGVYQAKERVSWQKRIQQLERRLAQRAVIDRAKGKLMDERRWTEEQAYHYLRQAAMNERKTMQQVADEVLSAKRQPIFAGSTTRTIRAGSGKWK
ncbi:hypothetical protein JIR001_01310 [Polycladomyces abyssicola]|uniref:ANTAR domain-containing protein n=1 Tax=Polycladomyces abyssicola TaxID=1125966 RepID=A0A8D5UDL5_9BACL|nr:ANTAR domain-containing protein [Polycladomyces abyssicola]BCU80348.1 hypothetical protein JIR001_01310 [Polycladomyces abyssicola]